MRPLKDIFSICYLWSNLFSIAAIKRTLFFTVYFCYFTYYFEIIIIPWTFDGLNKIAPCSDGTRNVDEPVLALNVLIH